MLDTFTEVEFEKILYGIEKMNLGKSVDKISLSKTSFYNNKDNEYVVKTDKVYQDEYIKLSVTYA